MALPSSETIGVGGVRLDLLDEGSFRLDGGAMFRVVPKLLWERTCPPTPSTGSGWRCARCWSGPRAGRS